MIKFDEKGEITKEWKEYISNLSREDLEVFAIGADAYAEELEKDITDATEYIQQQRLHKFQDSTGGLTYEERKLLEILKHNKK